MSDTNKVINTVSDADKTDENDEMRPEYGPEVWKGAERGKYYRLRREELKQANQSVNTPETETASKLTDDRVVAVLMNFANAQAGGNSAALADWSARYPALVRDFGRIAEAAWSQTNGRGDVENAENAARFREIGRAALRAALPGYVPAAPVAPLTNLLQAAKDCGLSKDEFAAALSIPDTLLLKLHRRLIDAATVPAALIEKAADALNRTFDEIADYLRLPAQMPRAASFRADSTPQIKTENFADALASDPDALPEHKAAWLDENRADGGAA